MRGNGSRAAGVARERSTDEHENADDAARSHKSSGSRRTVHSRIEEEVEELKEQLKKVEGKLQGKKNQIEEERQFVGKLCEKLGFVMKTASFHSDIEKKIDEIQGKLTKRDTLIGGLKKMFEAENILPAVENDGHLVACVKELKDFSVEIGKLLQVTGDVDLTAYKNKAREIMESETRQKESITHLESEVVHFKTLVQEKEANISDLQKTIASLKSMEDMSDDSLKKSAQDAEAKALTYQQEIRKYERVTSEQQDKVDKLGTELDELKSQLLQVTSQSAAQLQQFTDKVARRVKQIEAEKSGVQDQLRGTTADFNEMSRKYDEENRKYKALQHENETHRRQLEKLDREVKFGNDNLNTMKEELSTTKNKLHEHVQTIATINTRLQKSDEEITRLQGLIRDHEKYATTTAAHLKRLEGIETQFNARRGGESAELKTANDQIKQKDGEIHKITAELASTKSELSKSNIEIDKVRELHKTQRSLIDNLTREKQNAEDSIILLKRQVQRLSAQQQIVRTPESSESRQVMADDTPTFQGGSGGGGGGDYPSQSYHQYAPHDTNGHGDQASVHFAHLLARLRELLGEEPSIALVDDLVNAFEHHIRTNTAQQALLRRIRPDSATSRYPMTFHECLYDYLLEHSSMIMSIQDQLKQLREKGTPDGTDV